MAVTYIPPYPGYDAFARSIADAGRIVGEGLTHQQDVQRQRSQNLVNLLDKFANSDPGYVSNFLRGLDAQPDKSVRDTFGVSSRNIGIRSAEAVAPGLPVPALAERRGLVANPSPTIAVSKAKAELDSEKLRGDQVRQAMGIAASTEKRAARGEQRTEDEFGVRMANLRIDSSFANRAKWNDFFVTDPSGRKRKTTSDERDLLNKGLAEGKTAGEAGEAIGLSNIETPPVLQAQVLEMTDAMTKLGYKEEDALDIASTFLITNPINLSDTQLETQQLLGELHLANIAESRARTRRLNNSPEDAAEGASQDRLRGNDLTDSLNRVYAPFVGHSMQGVKVVTDGPEKGRVLTNVTAQDKDGNYIKTLPVDFLAALVDPSSSTGVLWLMQHNISPPIGPDDVQNVREVLDGLARDGVQLDKITLNIPDVTSDGRRTVRPQELKGADQIIAYVTTARQDTMNARAKAGEAAREVTPEEGAGGVPIRRVPRPGGPLQQSPGIGELRMREGGVTPPTTTAAPLVPPAAPTGGAKAGAASAPQAAPITLAPLLERIKKGYDEQKATEDAIKRKRPAHAQR